MKHILLSILLLATPAHAACTAAQPKYLLFGDSRCWNWYGTQVPTIGEMLQTACPQAQIISDCMPSRGTVAMGYEAPLPVHDQLVASLDQHHPDVCLIQLDVGDAYVPGQTPDMVVDQQMDLGTTCKQHGARPVFLTGFPFSESNQSGVGSWLGEVRMKTIKTAANRGWKVIDSADAFDQLQWSPCTIGGTNPPDGVHPFNVACRQQWADYVAPRLP